MTKKIIKHYQELLMLHGDSAEAAQYASVESQERRFEMLINIGNLSGAKILDFGCGTGHLATYLKKKGIDVKYTGVDVVDDLLSVGRMKHPEHRFGKLGDISFEKFDYVLVSGVFNNKHGGNRKFYQNSIRTLFDLCDRGLSFNMMSTYVDFRNDELFYESPERVFRFVKNEITPFVTLRHDYEVKSGVIPFEFIIYAYRSGVK